jgi:hypothetical protein
MPILTMYRALRTIALDEFADVTVSAQIVSPAYRRSTQTPTRHRGRLLARRVHLGQWPLFLSLGTTLDIQR